MGCMGLFVTITTSSPILVDVILERDGDMGGEVGRSSGDGEPWKQRRGGFRKELLCKWGGTRK